MHEAEPTAPTAMGKADVCVAAARLRGLVRRTPVLRCAALDAIAGAELWLKAENLQRIGAFKARGAMHAVGQLGAQERARGIITFSSGNHAQAVALAAREFETRATIAMPTDAPPIKLDAVRKLGAEIVLAGTTSDHRREAALEIQNRTRGVIIQPFDHPHIVAGQGTATLELMEQVAEATQGGGLDALIVPVGGGGLIAGACLATDDSPVRIYSAEPHGCDALAQSLDSGERVSVSPGPTLADGLKPVRVGELNFAIARRRVHQWYRVDDEEIGTTLVRLLIRAKVLVEPSGAAALAVALRGQLPENPSRIGVILSGGNVSPDLVGDLLQLHGARA